MNPLSLRDRWLAAALPALVILLVGWVFYLRPAEKAISLLAQRVENQGSLQAKQDMISLARNQQASLETTVAQLRDARPPAGVVFNRNLAMQQISRECDAHGLSLTETKLNPSDAQLPAALRTAALSLNHPPGATLPQIWQIELTGTYGNVMKLLGGLQDADALIVPLNLSMTTDKRERKPTSWTLTLWL